MVQHMGYHVVMLLDTKGVNNEMPKLECIVCRNDINNYIPQRKCNYLGEEANPPFKKQKVENKFRFIRCNQLKQVQVYNVNKKDA